MDATRVLRELQSVRLELTAMELELQRAITYAVLHGDAEPVLNRCRRRVRELLEDVSLVMPTIEGAARARADLAATPVPWFQECADRLEKRFRESKTSRALIDACENPGPVAAALIKVEKESRCK